jgi:hypothetical protein
MISHESSLDSKQKEAALRRWNNDPNGVEHSGPYKSKYK